MKLVELPKHKEKLEPNDYTVKVLQDLLALAKKGEIQSLVAVTAGNGRVGHIIAPPETMAELMMHMATLDLVKLELAESLYAGVDYEPISDDTENPDDENES